MTKKSAIAVGALGIALALLAGCGAGKSAPAAKHVDRKGRGNTLAIALSSTPKTLDPIQYTGTYEGNIIINVADTVVRYNQALSSIVPDLAKSWTVSDDGKDYTFILRDDVHFQKGKYQDGRAMTAEDVKYSLERSARKSAMNRLEMLASRRREGRARNRLPS